MIKRTLIICVITAALAGFCFLISVWQPTLSGSINRRNPRQEKITTLIVPHFDLFKEKRRELFEKARQTSSPDTIVLVSVNHFNAGESDIATTDKEWQVASGSILPDRGRISTLTGSQIANADEAAFSNEHGIKNILADIKEAFPQSNIVPIIIKDTTSKSTVDQLLGWVSNSCRDCLMVASVDFSHYCPSSLARVHDTYTLQALENLDEDKIWQAETDSPQTLYLALALARKNHNNFHLFYQANSSDVGGKDAEVTSIVLGSYSNRPAEAKSDPATTFVIAGDVMLDRGVWNSFQEKGLKDLFDRFGTRPFRGTDLSLVNLEGPISPTPLTGKRPDQILNFSFPPVTPDLLAFANINTVSLANNHTANAGAAGLADTKTALIKAGIRQVGLPEGIDAASILRIDGPVPLSLISVSTFTPFDQEALTETIRSEKAAGRFVLVFPHWGQEYQTSHNAAQEELATNWLKAGADTIIGSHPHVVQDSAMIEGKPVIYSLGNFIFDQAFSESTQRGLVVAGIITKETVTLSFLPTRERLIYPEFLTGSEKTEALDAVLKNQGGFIKKSYDTIESKR